MPNSFSSKLVTTPSLQYLLEIVSVAEREIFVVSPWIMGCTLNSIVGVTKLGRTISWKVLTRGNHKDFCDGFSDIEAFKRMIGNSSFDLRANRRLHAKVYVVDRRTALITSANLTEGGMQHNPEVGLAITDPDEISELMKELDKWFKEAEQLTPAWLEAEQRALEEFENSKVIDFPFDPKDYHSLDIDAPKSNPGKYRELPMPDGWIPILDSLKEIDPLPHPIYLTFGDLMPVFNRLLEYLRKSETGRRREDLLVERFIYNRTQEEVAQNKGVTRERISQLIGIRDNSENVWATSEGKIFLREISAFLANAISITSLRVGEKLLSTPMEPFGLSPMDIGRMLCGLIEDKIVLGNFQTKITAGGQLLIFDKAIYAALRDLERVFCEDYQRFLDLDRFFHLGELEEIDEQWFSPELSMFDQLFLTKARQVGRRDWNKEKAAEAIAWELADKLEFYYWHYSEMSEALKYLFPLRFGATSVRSVEACLQRKKDRFQHAGSKGYWQLADLGDGYHTNKEAIIDIFNRLGRTSLTYKQVCQELRERGRRINDGSIYALLDRDESFHRLRDGRFQLVE